jgi:hypothetical protein
VTAPIDILLDETPTEEDGTMADLLKCEVTQIRLPNGETGYAVTYNDAPDDIQEPLRIAFATEASAQEFAAMVREAYTEASVGTNLGDVMTEFCRQHEIGTPRPPSDDAA